MNPNPGGRKWVEADDQSVQGAVTGRPPDMQWYQKTTLGDKVCPANPQYQHMARLEALLLMWPPKHLQLILDLANGNNMDGSKKKAQGKCRGRCGKDSTRVCSKCTHPTDPTQQQYWFCDPCKEGGCKKWLEHLAWHQENDA